jgi:exosome complex RNA-binding protein Rrp42 (RNase PH superfamily)
VVYVDALVLNDGGNVMDALSIAARAALALTRVYKVCGSTAAGLMRQRQCSSSSSTMVLTFI